MNSKQSVIQQENAKGNVTMQQLAEMLGKSYQNIYMSLFKHPKSGTMDINAHRRRFKYPHGKWCKTEQQLRFVSKEKALRFLVTIGKISDDDAVMVLRFDQLGEKTGNMTQLDPTKYHQAVEHAIKEGQELARQYSRPVILATQKNPAQTRVISSISEDKTAIRVCGEEIQSRGPVNQQTPLSKNWFNHLMTDVAVTFLGAGGHRDLGATYTRQQVRDIIAACLERVFSENTVAQLKQVVRSPEHDARTGEIIDVDRLD